MKEIETQHLIEKLQDLSRQAKRSVQLTVFIEAARDAHELEHEHPGGKAERVAASITIEGDFPITSTTIEEVIQIAREHYDTKVA
jgi:hypothetical protein